MPRPPSDLRSWTRTDLGSAVQWRADGALVQVTSPEADIWLVDLFEYNQFIGQEREGCRASALCTAKRWVKALTRPAGQ